MSEQQNIEIVKEMYAAFGRGDVDAIVAKCTPNVEWVTHLDPLVPWSGDHSGKDFVPAFFGAIFGSVDVTMFEPREWVAQGDTVVSMGAFGCTFRASGKSVTSRWIFVWKFKDGMVTSYEQFHDENLVEAFR